MEGKTGTVKMPNNFDAHTDEEFDKRLIEVLENAELGIKGLKSKNKTKKLYFAAPWFDDRSKKIYSACEKIVELCNEYSEYEVFFPRKQENECPSDAFVKNVCHIYDADIVVALISRKDCGTAWEIGMSFASNKRLILLGYDETTFLSHTNVMLAFSGTCITIDNLCNILCNKDYTTVRIKNEWEGIE